MSGRSRRAPWLVGILAILIASFDVAPAKAHTSSQSFSTWQVSHDGDVRLSFSVAAREVTRLVSASDELLALEPLMARHLLDRVALLSGEEMCPPVGLPRALVARAEYVRVEWRFRCPPLAGPASLASQLVIQLGVFFDVAPSHIHFARVEIADAPGKEFLFSNAVRERSLALRSGVVSTSSTLTFKSYVVLGVEHILAGLDHIAFLLALLLITRRARDVALLVTGFTLGHSVTLSLAVLGVLEPPIDVIESLIGFTVAWVAAEATSVATNSGFKVGAAGGLALFALALLSLFAGVGPPALLLAGLALFTFCSLSLVRTREVAIRLSPVLCALFGLVHGFGFASVLTEIGLPRDRLIPALFGFNVGVEIGQLAIVAGLFCAGVFAARLVRPRRMVLGTDLLSAALCGLGLFWFAERAYGG